MHFVGTGTEIDAVELEEVFFSSMFETRFEEQQGKVVLTVGTHETPIRSFDCEKGTKALIRQGEQINTSENPDDPEFKLFDILCDLELVRQVGSRRPRPSTSTCDVPPTEADTQI